MENLNKIYHLDEPLWSQYLLYLKSIAQLDFGPSFYFRDFTINELFAQSLADLDAAGPVGALPGSGRWWHAWRLLAALRQNHVRPTTR